MNKKTNVCVLASTSSGNCTVIWNNSISILVDCGTTISYTEEALANLGLSIDKLSAVFITHCHSDHVNQYMINRLLKHNIPIYCHANVAAPLKKILTGLKEKNSSLVAFAEESIPCSGFSYKSFSVPHDSKGGCFGYSFFIPHDKGKHKVSISTDIGFTDSQLVTHFADSDIIIIESNHDVQLLAQSSRPKWLKDRIVKIGHLSNEQCAAFVQAVLAASQVRPAAIVLAHISQECNTNLHAVTCMNDALAFAKKQHITVVETHKEKPSIVVSI